jgi:hypothetical protein
LNTIALAQFKEEIRSRGPLVVDGGNPRLAKEKLLALFDGMLTRLSAKLEVHQQHAAEKKESESAKITVDHKAEAERLRRYEQACHRRATRCEAAYWKHRREVDEAGLAFEDSEDGFDMGVAADLGAESVGAEAATNGPDKNLTSEPRVAVDAAEAEALQEVARVDKELAQACEELRRMRDSGIEAFIGQGGSCADGKAALAAAIFGRGPLLQPVT